MLAIVCNLCTAFNFVARQGSCIFCCALFSSGLEGPVNNGRSSARIQSVRGRSSPKIQSACITGSVLS